MFLRAITAGLVLFASLLLLPVVLFSIVHAGFPNSLEAPVLPFASLFSSLHASNAAAAFRLLAAQPLMLVSHAEINTGLRVWEVYAYPFPTLVLLSSALYSGVIVVRGHLSRNARAQLVAGLGILVLALSYARVATCCTGPGWVVDIWLRGLALTPAPDSGLDWSAFYQRIESLLAPGQAVLVLTGLALLALAARNGAVRR